MKRKINRGLLQGFQPFAMTIGLRSKKSSLPPFTKGGKIESTKHSRLYSKIFTVITAIMIALFTGCSLFEGPEKEGQLAIVIEFPSGEEVTIQPQTGKAPGPNISTTIERVFCAVTRNDVVVWDGDLNHSGGYFTGNIELSPGGGYEVGVECWIGNQVAYTGSQSNITITAGETTTAYLSIYPTTPSAPQFLSASALSGTQIELTWTDMSVNETGFKIERSTGAPGAFVEIDLAGEDATTYLDIGLNPDTDYYYRVRAYNSAGYSGYSNIAHDTTFLVTTIPDPPSNLQATAVSSSQINLNWQDNTDNEEGFIIERRVGPSGGFSKIDTVNVNENNYENSGLTPNTNYYYRICAFNSMGNSNYTNIVNDTTFQVTTVPDPPSNLQATAVSSSQINLNWQDNSDNEEGFIIEQRVGTSGGFAKIDTVNVNENYFDNSGLNPNTNYYYRVCAFNSMGNSNYTNISNDTTFQATTTPNPPSNLQAMAVSSSQINLSWQDNSDNEEGFIIERRIGTSGGFLKIDTVTVNENYFENYGLNPNTNYYYRVCAYNSMGNSNYTNISNDTTFQVTTVPNPPSNLQATAMSSTQINLNWQDNSDNEEGFIIERKIGFSGAFDSIAATGVNITSFTDYQVAVGNTYYYKACAYVDNYFSNYSNIAYAPVTGIVGSCDTPDIAYGVAIVGSYTYVADGASGLQVINIANPSIPYITGYCDTPGITNRVAVAGSYAYVTDSYSGLQVINITNPTSPYIAGACDTPGNAVGVAVVGSYTYVADGYSGLQVINIANPASPYIAGFCDTPGFAWRVAVAGNYAYVADRSWLQVINITNPSNPYIAGSCAIPDSAYSVAVTSSYAYVADEISGLQCINITNPSNPYIVGSCDTPDCAIGISVAGSYAYVADGSSGLQIINIANPSSPYIVGSCDTPDYSRGVVVAGSYAYMADGYSGLQVIYIGEQ